MPVDQSLLFDAEELVMEVFSIKDRKKLFLSASVKQDIFAFKNAGIESASYWCYIKEGKLIGITGIYTLIGDEIGRCWLGWFCVDRRFRKNGYGKRMLEWSEEKAINMGKKVLSLYSYRYKKYQKALSLYESSGYTVMQKESSKYKRKIYLEKVLRTEKVK